MVTVGGDKGCGQFLVAGGEKNVSTLGPRYNAAEGVKGVNNYIVVLLFRVATCLEAKGGGRKGRYQGKAQKLEKRSEAETIIREHFKSSLCDDATTTE